MKTWTEPWFSDLILNSISTMEQSMYLSAFWVFPIVSQPKFISSSFRFDFLGGHLNRARPSSLIKTS